MRIFYSREDVDLILEHYNDLRSGIWTQEQHIDFEVRKPGTSRRANFEDACLIAGEIAARVKLCGQDGMLVEECYGMVTGIPMTEGQIEKARHIPLYEIERRINRVKWFCVGRKRKRPGRDDRGELLSAYEFWKQRSRTFHHYRLGHVLDTKGHV